MENIVSEETKMWSKNGRRRLAIHATRWEWKGKKGYEINPNRPPHPLPATSAIRPCCSSIKEPLDWLSCVRHHQNSYCFISFLFGFCLLASFPSTTTESSPSSSSTTASPKGSSTGNTTSVFPTPSSPAMAQVSSGRGRMNSTDLSTTTQGSCCCCCRCCSPLNFCFNCRRRPHDTYRFYSLSKARRFYSSMGKRLGSEMLIACKAH